jgi:4-hydroxybenzoate polyprenyltransferase
VLDMVIEKAGDFLRYVRFELCIFSAFIAASGYLLNNLLSGDLLFVMMSSFFVCAGAYSYNNMTDKTEDLINRKKANPFASNVAGKIATVLAFSLGFLFSLFLSPASVVFYVIAVFTSVAYSAFRLKKYLFLKNIYTGFGVTQVFLIGAANSPITSEIISYYVLLSVLILIESMISDLRDYAGDKAADIRTLPVYVGYEKVRYLILFAIAVYSALIILFTKLLVLLPFTTLMFLAINENKPHIAHSLGSYSLIFLLPWMAMGEVVLFA